MKATKIWSTIASVRDVHPFIQNINNEVVTELTTQAIVSLGGSQATLWDLNEAADCAAIASAQVVSIGTPSDDWAAAAIEAVKIGRQRNLPWVLDPVAYGVLPYRTELADTFLDMGPGVIKGNASEILSVAGAHGQSVGADSTTNTEDALDAANEVAARFDCVVMVTGVRDLITDGMRVTWLSNGHELMASHTGTGCMLGAVTGCALAVAENAYEAAVAAAAYFSIAGEIAAENSKGPGSLRMNLFDALYALTTEEIQQRLHLQDMS